MGNRELFDRDRDPIDSGEWSQSSWDIDDESFAQAIAAGRADRQAA